MFHFSHDTNYFGDIGKNGDSFSVPYNHGSNPGVCAIIIYTLFERVDHLTYLMDDDEDRIGGGSNPSSSILLLYFVMDTCMAE
jgi:hypothetical protein